MVCPHRAAVTHVDAAAGFGFGQPSRDFLGYRGFQFRKPLVDLSRSSLGVLGGRFGSSGRNSRFRKLDNAGLGTSRVSARLGAVRRGGAGGAPADGSEERLAA
jgi:hypothetical protein